MSKESVVFTNEEIEEIDIYAELTENLKVDGNQVICFKVLSDLLNNRIKDENINKKMLIKVYSQLKESESVFSELIWFDSSIIEQMITKINKHINKLIKRV